MNERHDTVARFCEAIDPSPYQRHIPPEAIRKANEVTRQKAITTHMQHARACRSLLNRIRDTDHERRRATVATMQDHVHKAKQINRTIVRMKQEAPR